MKKPDTSPEKETIHLAMAAILRDIDKIAKERKNEQQGFKFRGIDDCYNALHPIFAAHGVTCVPFVESLETSIPGVNAKGNNIYRSVVKMIYKFTAADGSTQEAKTVGEGMDSADKATAKALSACHKYLLLQTFLIPTAELLDADAYDPTVMPREELARIREEEAQRAVLAGDTRLANDQALALAKKRAEAKGTTVEEELEIIRKEEEDIAEALPPERARKGAQSSSGQKEPKQPSTPSEGTKEPEPEKKGTTRPQEPPDDPSADERLERFKVLGHRIKFVKHAKYLDKLISELTLEDFLAIKKKWIDPNQEAFKDQPAKQEEANMILKAIEILSTK